MSGKHNVNKSQTSEHEESELKKKVIQWNKTIGKSSLLKDKQYLNILKVIILYYMNILLI